eukprot:gnl/TRDRNA2_/TRDRNA2_41953_c0_seq1.p2 gnl/TRDRNA2_/TRDRNA2_41953_c0~~gnl/TRDRNA2_/TRDRNA2_41953_c0_seq1.p2  ORF type:complete len:111 (+),score=20.12 gnl/TRDRNA2_/TRDRNA2_41953_c0_seq1:206-538(+)
MKAHDSWVQCLDVEWMSTPKRALTGSADGTLRLWNLDESTLLETLRGHEDEIECLSVDWGSMKALSGSVDMTLKMWDLDRYSKEDPVCIATLEGHHGMVRCVAANLSLGG